MVRRLTTALSFFHVVKLMTVYTKTITSLSDATSGDSGFDSRAEFTMFCWPNGKAPDYGSEIFVTVRDYDSDIFVIL